MGATDAKNGDKALALPPLASTEAAAASFDAAAESRALAAAAAAALAHGEGAIGEGIEKGVASARSMPRRALHAGVGASSEACGSLPLDEPQNGVDGGLAAPALKRLKRRSMFRSPVAPPPSSSRAAAG
jgi:hypothetical protein